MTGRRVPAVPGGATALRQPNRPPIPDDAEQAGPAPSQTASQPPAALPSSAAALAASEAPAAPASQAPGRAPAGAPAAQPNELASQIASQAGGTLAPPPAVERHVRVQLNTKFRLDLRERLDAFVELHNSTLQAVLEAAAEEYMTVRGYTPDVHRRGRRAANR